MYPGGDFAKILGEGHEDGRFWVPAEVDVSIRPGWFWHKSQDSLVRSPGNLLDLYYSSVGRNSNLLLNVPPDQRGLLNEADVKSLMAFRELREKEFCKDLALGHKASSSPARGRNFRASNINDGNPETYWCPRDGAKDSFIKIDLGPSTIVNRIVLGEYIRLGQRVQAFTVEGLEGGKWKKLIEGTTIGHKVIRKFPAINTSAIRVTFNKSKAVPLISELELYRAPGE
jgi:alpha-L-fucosidase